MRKLLLCLIGAYLVIGIVVCVVACSTYFKASELEFRADRAARCAVTKVIEVSDTSKGDTCKKYHSYY